MRQTRHSRHRFGCHVRERCPRAQRRAVVFPGLLRLRQTRRWSGCEGHKRNKRRLQASRMLLGNVQHII